MYEISFEEYQKVSRTHRKKLLKLPLLGMKELLPYVTLRPGIRYSEVVGGMDIDDVELAPYKTNSKKDVDLDLALRDLRTYFGSLNAVFEPNKYISTLLGHSASKAAGDGLKTTPTALDVMGLIAKKVGRKLGFSAWNGVRNPKGTTTKDLADGFDTITAAEIEAGNISEAKGNYIKLTKKLTAANACDLIKEAVFRMAPELRQEDTFIYCSYGVTDAYNESYLMTHSSVPYNTQYDQPTLEAAGGKLTFVPLVGKTGSKYIHVSVKDNMLVGCDQLSDQERVGVRDDDVDTLLFYMRMFFGLQFESVDARRLFVIELADEDEEPAEEPGNTPGGGDNPDNGGQGDS